MENFDRPTKEQVRQWLIQRWQSHAPLPDAEHIRRQLGWTMASRKSEQPIQQANLSDDAFAV